MVGFIVFDVWGNVVLVGFDYFGIFVFFWKLNKIWVIRIVFIVVVLLNKKYGVLWLKLVYFVGLKGFKLNGCLVWRVY